METPCIKKCVLKDNICTGCGRNVNDIRNWMFMDDVDRSLAMYKAEENIKQLNILISVDNKNE